MIVIDWLKSDVISVLLLSEGIPACAFLIGYALASRRMRRAPYLLGAGMGVSLSVGGALVANWIVGNDSMSLIVFPAWPLAWTLISGFMLLRNRRTPLVVAVFAGSIADLLTVYAMMPYSLFMLGRKSSVLAFFVFLTGAGAAFMYRLRVAEV
jgi:hypothetical protein